MPKVTVTFEDKVQDGVEGVELVVNCDPEVSRETTHFTPAMQIGIAVSRMWDTGELNKRAREIFEEMTRK
jgi:hypothetical protein